MNSFVIENDDLLVEFDEAGALVRLKNKRTCWDIQRRRELAESFAMVVPIKDRRNNKVLGQKQAPPKIKAGKAGKSLMFTWNGVQSEHGGMHDIRLVATVTLGQFGLEFTGKVDNRSKQTVETVAWPCLGDLSAPAPGALVEQVSFGYGEGSRLPVLPKFQSQKGYWGIDHPTMMAAAPESMFILIDAQDQGLYFGYHDVKTAELVAFMGQCKPGLEIGDDIATGTVGKDTLAGKPAHVTYDVIHYPFVAGGEAKNFSPIVVRPYAGDWHAGADCYKAWRRTWFKAPKAPVWAKDVHSWHQIHINSPEDELRCRYEDLVKYGEDCARHGVKAIQLVGWNCGGQDRGNPSHDTDPRLGSSSELKAAIAKIESLGVRMVLFNKYSWADRSSPWFRKELVKYASKDPYGDYYFHQGYQYQTPTQLMGINTRRLIPMCHLHAPWRKIACKEFRKSVDLGASGMLYDESRNHGAFYCFDPKHTHDTPGHVFAGDAMLAEDFQEVVKQARKKEYLFAGEDCYDLQFQHYHLSYFRIYACHHFPLARYVDPRAEMMVAMVSFNDRRMINQAMRYRYIISYEPYNFKGRLDDFPQTVEYGKKVDDLRRMYRRFLWDGEFRDTLGATVKSDDKPYADYSVFVDGASGKSAIVITNQSEKPVRIVASLGGPKADIVKASPEQPQAVPSKGAVEIPALSAIILMEN